MLLAGDQKRDGWGFNSDKSTLAAAHPPSWCQGTWGGGHAVGGQPLLACKEHGTASADREVGGLGGGMGDGKTGSNGVQRGPARVLAASQRDLQMRGRANRRWSERAAGPSSWMTPRSKHEKHPRVRMDGRTVSVPHGPSYPIPPMGFVDGPPLGGSWQRSKDEWIRCARQPSRPRRSTASQSVRVFVGGGLLPTAHRRVALRVWQGRAWQQRDDSQQTT